MIKIIRSAFPIQRANFLLIIISDELFACIVQEREAGAAVTLHQRIVAHKICPISNVPKVLSPPLPEEHECWPKHYDTLRYLLLQALNN